MKGFTLLETLVTILIFSFIIGGIYGVMNITNTNYDANLVSLNLQRQARQGMSWLVREIRQASFSTILDKDNNRNSITFNRPGEPSVTYSLVPNNSLCNKGTINLPTSQLWRNYPTGQVVANDIVGLTFYSLPCDSCCDPVPSTCTKEYIPLQKIKLEVCRTFSSLGNERTLEFSLTEQVTVRNP